MIGKYEELQEFHRIDNILIQQYREDLTKIEEKLQLETNELNKFKALYHDLHQFKSCMDQDSKDK